MRRITMFLTLALMTSACDDVDQDREAAGTITQKQGELKVSGAIAADLRACGEEAPDDAVGCIKQVLAGEESPGDGAPFHGDFDLVSGDESEVVGLLQQGHSCSSKDGKVDCYCSGGCKRTQHDCNCT